MSETSTEAENKTVIRTSQNEKDSTYIIAKDDDLQKNPSTKNANNDENTEDVDAVVTKAKRAATFLWTLLHSQVCPIGSGKCRHQGCTESKRLLLHIKTCPATSEFPCPTSHSGCQQARRLLCHYRKCKDMRMKQRRQKQQTNNLCLICTLLSRHDKSISNSLSICSRVPTSTPKKRSEQSHGLSSSFDKIYSPQVRRRKARSKSVQFDLHREAKTGDMPPPPPRPRTTSVDVASLPTLHQTASILQALQTGKGHYRPRAGSLDEKRRSQDTFGNDPTVEFELRAPLRTNDLEAKQVESQLPFRKRSVSCSVVPCGKSPAACDTIMEE